MNDIFKPYLQKENAIAWLSGRLCPKPLAVFRKGGPFPRATLEADLSGGGFVRVEKKSFVEDGYIRVAGVQGPGEFSIDGDSADVWPFGSREPFRVIAVGDVVDSIYPFDPDSQEPGDDGDRLEVMRYGETLHGIDREAVYHTAIASGIILDGKDVLARYPSRILAGLRAGGRKLVEVAFLCRCCEEAAREGSGGDATAYANRMEAFLEDWAALSGAWNRDPEGELYTTGPLVSEEGRSLVFRDGDDVLKLRPVRGSVVEEIDAVAIYNALFPVMAVTVEGFGRNRRGELSLVLRQRFAEGESPSVEEIRTALGAAGLAGGDGVYQDRWTLVEDSGTENWVKVGGKAVPWSLDMARMNEPAMHCGGTWRLPDLRSDRTGVDAIGRALEKVVPESVDREEFLRRHDTKENMLASQLDVTGRYDGYVTERYATGTERTFAVANDPASPDGILRMECGRIAVMLDGEDTLPEKELHEICYGFGMWIDGRFTAFDIASGHLVRAFPYLDTLRNDLYFREQESIIQGLSREKAEKKTKAKGKGKGRRKG